MFLEDFAGRSLPFDSSSAADYTVVVAAPRRAGAPISQFDGKIAAIALSHRLGLATRNVSDFEGCGLAVDDVRSFQQADKLRIATAKMIDPHRRVDQDQTGIPWRLRGAAFNLGCVPPSRARRLALSRSMSAFNPSFTMAVRSIGPAIVTWPLSATTACRRRRLVYTDGGCLGRLKE